MNSSVVNINQEDFKNLKQYLNDYINNIDIPNSNHMLLMFRFSEELIKLSKRYNIDRKILKEIKIYRNLIAHSNFIEKSKDLQVMEETIYNNLKTKALETIITSKKDSEIRIYSDEEIIKILIDNNIDIFKYKVYRLDHIPNIPELLKERNYLIFEGIDNKEMNKIKNIIGIATNGAINIRILKDINKEYTIPQINTVMW